MAESTFDVVIVGAGLAGLSSAYRIKQKSPKLKILVLEANPRVGGRTQTLAILNHEGQPDTFDLGAHWICKRQNYVMDLVEKFGIEYYPQNTTGKKVLQVGLKNQISTYKTDIPSLNVKALIEMQLIINEVEKLAQQVDISNPYGSIIAKDLDNVSIENFVKSRTNYEEINDIFNAAVNASMGCDSSQISALFFLAYANSAGGVMNLLLVDNSGAQEFRVKGGTQEISKHLQREIGETNVLLDHPVQSIDQLDRDLVKIVCENGKVFHAKRVVLTTPPNKIAKIKFDPPLPKQQSSLFESLQMGNLIKVFLIYKTPFWLKNGFSGEVVTTGGPSFAVDCERGPVSIVYDATTSNGTPALVCFVSGKNGDQWLDKSKTELMAAVVNQMTSYFGEEARNPAQFHVKDWREEEYIGGGPCNLTAPGQMHKFFLLRRPFDRVHFAGTATATHWCGYMSGAIESGYRAASEVLKILDRSGLTAEDYKMIEKAHPKRGFPYERGIWKVTRTSCINRTLVVGILTGILLTTYRHKLFDQGLKLANAFTNFFSK